MNLKALPLFLLITCLYTTVNGQTERKNSTSYIHAKRRSVSAHAIHAVLSVAGLKKRAAKKHERLAYKAEPARLPSSISKKFDVQITKIQERNIWTIAPRKDKTEKVILFLHGGAYVENLLSFHWDFVEEVCRDTKATFIVADYPLAPSYQCEEIYVFVHKLYESLLQSGIKAHNIDFMGDSAGGGLALGFAQQLRDQNKPLPNQIILLAPWLDVTLVNVDETAMNNKDKMLAIPSLQKAGQLYAGDLDVKNYRVSPLYGSFEGLPSIALFIGTYDSIIFDCRILKEKLEAAGMPIQYYEYPKMFHDWMMVKHLNEAKDARDQIKSLLK